MTTQYKNPLSLHTRMDESELDEWFNEQRDQLEKKFYKLALEKQDWAPLQKEFDENYKRLIKVYQERQQKIYEQQRRTEKHRVPLRKYRAWKAERVSKFERWKKKTKAAWKKWLFDRKIKKILNLNLF